MKKNNEYDQYHPKQNTQHTELLQIQNGDCIAKIQEPKIKTQAKSLIVQLKLVPNRNLTYSS